jgi:hypothetical protein
VNLPSDITINIEKKNQCTILKRSRPQIRTRVNRPPASDRNSSQIMALLWSFVNLTNITIFLLFLPFPPISSHLQRIREAPPTMKLPFNQRGICSLIVVFSLLLAIVKSELACLNLEAVGQAVILGIHQGDFNVVLMCSAK